MCVFVIIPVFNLFLNLLFLTSSTWCFYLVWKCIIIITIVNSSWYFVISVYRILYRMYKIPSNFHFLQMNLADGTGRKKKWKVRLLAVSGSRPGPGTLFPDPNPDLQGRVPGSHFRPLFCHIFGFFAHYCEFSTQICKYLGHLLTYRNSKGTKICRKNRAFLWHGQNFN